MSPALAAITSGVSPVRRSACDGFARSWSKSHSQRSTSPLVAASMKSGAAGAETGRSRSATRCASTCAACIAKGKSPMSSSSMSASAAWERSSASCKTSSCLASTAASRSRFNPPISMTSPLRRSFSSAPQTAASSRTSTRFCKAVVFRSQGREPRVATAASNESQNFMAFFGGSFDSAVGSLWSAPICAIALTSLSFAFRLHRSVSLLHAVSSFVTATAHFSFAQPPEPVSSPREKRRAAARSRSE
mmetsp:Transcript_34086/g.72513  ORF Transcript_34086/g.72513 Transcript_34086/m.72513 type:complete len:247 (-) Transcript_34086:309-1049(-)